MRKASRGLAGYTVMIAVFILLAVVLSGMNNTPAPENIEYNQLLTFVKENKIAKVAIDGTTLYGMYRTGSRVTSAAQFPQLSDFKTVIGSDFIDTVRIMTAAKSGKSLDEISVADFPFTVQYVIPYVTPWYIQILPYLIPTAVLIIFWIYIKGRAEGDRRFPEEPQGIQ